MQPSTQVHTVKKIMPIKPHPVIISCPKCHWHTRYAPKSDAHILGMAEICPKCGNQHLTTRNASTVENMLANLTDPFQN